MGKTSNGNLVLACENETLNTTETLLDDENTTHQKTNSLLQSISLAIICLLLLVVISVSYYYYTRDRIKKEHSLSY